MLTFREDVQAHSRHAASGLQQVPRTPHGGISQPALRWQQQELDRRFAVLA
jgi:hypothetical protein